MTIDEELRLSYYKQISTLNASHNVFLVQHIETNKLYVKKILTVFNTAVYDYLKACPIPGTPRIYEAIQEDNQLIVIEDYINGSTLEDIVKTSGPMERQKALSVLMDLCGIVNSLHQASPPIIHRDIKPSNIIISEDGVVKLLDMNAAKRFNQFAAEDTSYIGTVGYAAPEQFGFGASSAQTDVYALGVVLNYLITGKLPKEKLAYGKIGVIVKECTEIDPQNRYADVYELYRALKTEADHIKQEKQYPASIPAEEKTKPSSRYIKWLPPGFRSLHPLKMLAAGFAYFMLIAAGLSMEVKNAPSGKEWIDKAFYFLFVLSSFLFLGNYMNIWSVFKIDKIKNPILKWICALMILGLILGIILTVMVIVENSVGYIRTNS